MNGPPKVLFVDDEPAVHEALARNLRRRQVPWTPVFQHDPRAALADAREAPPAVAVLDLLMPELDGLELAEQMRAAGVDCPILILSGCNDFAAAQAAINRAKAFRYYVKPCPTDDLIAGVAEALAQNRVSAAPDAPAAAAALGGVGDQALDRLAMGVVVIDDAGAVVFTNQRGGALLAARDGLILDSAGVCRAERRADSEALAAARRETLAQQESVALSIERADAAPLRLVAMPFDETGRVLLFITDPDGAAPLSAELIGQMFGLTRAEARLTASLAGGLDLAEAAERCGVTKATARSYLKQIFMKVGVSRQAELVQAVLTAAGAR